MIEYLLALGVIVLIVGVILTLTRRRGGLMLSILGGFWIFAVILYYIYRYYGFYGSTGGLNPASYGPAVTTAMGFILLIVGVVVAIMIARRAGGR